MIKKYFNLIDDGLAGKYQPDKFALMLEDFTENYSEMAKENQAIADFADNEMFDITEPMEPGMDPANFYKELEKAKLKMLEML